MAATGTAGTHAVVWPRGQKTIELSELAPRLASLEGATVGELWDDLFRGDEIFPVLRAELSKRYPGLRFVGYEVFGSTHGADEHRVVAELPAKLREHGVDAVISGVAC